MAKLRAMLQLSLVSPLLSVAQAGNGALGSQRFAIAKSLKPLNP